MTETYDAVVVGAGIAGLAVAAELSATRRVLVLEAERTHAAQATGRSATSWIARYGGTAVQAFTLASRAWFEAGGDGYVDRSLLTRRGMLLVTEDDGSPGLAAALAQGAEKVDASRVRTLHPGVREGVIVAGTYDPDSHDIDATTAVEACRARLRANGGELRVGAQVESIERDGRDWLVRSTDGTTGTGLVVDAAGAWADEVAARARVPPIGAAAYRRTICTFAAPPGVDGIAWPLLMDADERYYVKPESDGFLASPADATPQAPGPTHAHLDDVALALDHVERVTTLAPRSIRARWAGLRTFVPDRVPVLGPDPLVPGWAWYAALGGVGLMTAPAAARGVVSLIDRGALPDDIAALGARAPDVLPARLARSL
jgi:D-arginine dehydrogenase